MKCVRISVRIALCVMMPLVGCGDGGRELRTSSVQHDQDVVPGAPPDTLGGIDAETPDSDDASPRDDIGPGDIRGDDADAAADGGASPDDQACDRAARVAACDDRLLDPAPLPTYAADPLFYVNRAFAIPPAFPVSASSTWTPCSGGSAPDGVAHDLVCLPDAYTTQSVSLRQIAWASPAPAAPTATWDGKPVGHDGEIGFKAAFDAALDEASVELLAASCFRSYARQEDLFASYVANEMADGLEEDEATVHASTYSAEPGHSEHQLATTCDLVYRKDDGSISSFGRSVALEMYRSTAFRWLYANAHRFGLVVTYGHDRVDVTHYVWEPWHWRFVGVEAANAMRRCDLDTEELLNARYRAGALPPYAGDALILVDALAVVSADAGTLVVDPAERFVRTWIVDNVGTRNWWRRYLSHLDGEDFGGGDVEVACTPVLTRATLTLDLVAPTEPGTYEGRWAILGEDGGDLVPGQLDVRVVVRGGSGEADPYRFVRIDDLSNATGTNDPGVDLDALVLTKLDGGSSVFASAVSVYEARPGGVASNDPADALGPPDVFSAWPDTDTCDLSGGFVSLGGAGTIVLEMGAPFAEGDTLDVLEVGGCDFGAGSALADPYRVQISVGDAVTDTWEPLGTSSGGAARFIVPFLPPRRR